MSKHKPRMETSRVSCGGRAVIPGLVDSHTHAVFAGQRVDEFLRRGRGESYEEIAAAGGGIRNTAGKPLSKVTSKKLSERQPHALTECSSSVQQP